MSPAGVSAGIGLTLDLTAPVAAGMIRLADWMLIILGRERLDQRRWGLIYNAYRRSTPTFPPHPFILRGSRLG